MAALSQKFKELVATFVLGVPEDTSFPLPRIGIEDLSHNVK